jgi:hypothetical protein
MLHSNKEYYTDIVSYCLWGGVTQGGPYTTTSTDLLCFPTPVLIIPDSPTIALWQ